MIIIIFTRYCIREVNDHEPNYRNRAKILVGKNLQRLVLMRIVEEKIDVMTGERSRKELAGEVEKLKNMGKV